MILQGLAWLGLDPDEPPVFQSTRSARHAEVAPRLLAAGRAYRCYTSAEELRDMRERATAEGRPPRYDGRWRDRDPGRGARRRRPGDPPEGAAEGETVVDDLVQGQVRVANAELDDMIILRSDGTPTYLHAVVVDDHDMGITHVIRGDDHLTNTFRQVQIFDAMGWDRPRFAHIPLIHGADGAKLSKRHGAVSVLEFAGRASCRKRCATTCCGWAGAMATRRSSRATRPSPCSTWTAWAARPAGWTTPS